MLLKSYNDTLNVDWRLWTVEDRNRFIREMEASLQAQAAPSQPQQQSHQTGHATSQEEKFEVQSADVQHVPLETETSGSKEEQVIQFIDSVSETSITYNPILDNSFYSSYTPGVELEQFLSRPVLINTTTWNEASVMNVVLYPWYSFFNDTRIKKKLDNYAFLSCNLKIKIIINASPFYYGCAIASYQPLNAFTPSTIVNVSTYDDDLIPLSQRPHIWIYPQCSQGGELQLPFFWYKDWIRTANVSEFQDMGSLTIRQVSALLNANSVVSGGVTIQVYAWAENVRICGSTAALSLQSADEYGGSGIISKPASAIAHAAGILSSINFIAPYMTATQSVASGISKIAAWMGFTNTPVISDVQPIKNLPFHGFASSEIGQPVEKLALDPKNELTIDPRVVGLDGKDEMMIKSFISRESYLTQYNWATIDPVGTIIFAARVLPEYCAASGVFRQATPMAHVQHMFSFWRGDIIFRFRFICSQYHRGRARITWDPEGDIISDSVTSSVAFTKIVDISSEPDVEIRVPYLQALPWLATQSTIQSEYYGGAGFAFSHSPTADNGNITVRVFTQQTSPVASAPVAVIVSVRGGDNLEFAAPKELPNNLSVFSLQAQDETLSYDAPQIYDASAGGSGPHDDRFLVNMGESIVSFRQLLRRSTYSRTTSISTNTTARAVRSSLIFSRFPLNYGYDTNGINSAKGTLVPATDYSFNYVANTPFNWLADCFVGMRGSSTWHINAQCTEPVAGLRSMRYPVSIIPSFYILEDVLAVGSNNNVVSKFFRDKYLPGATGQSLTNQRTQTGCSIQAPMYSQFRMLSTSATTRTIGTSKDGSHVDFIRADIILKPSATTTSVSASTTVDLYHSIGTDFGFLFFLNVPTLVVCESPTAT